MSITENYPEKENTNKSLWKEGMLLAVISTMKNNQEKQENKKGRN